MKKTAVDTNLLSDKRELRRKAELWLLVAPGLIVVLVFVALPLLMVFSNSILADGRVTFRAYEKAISDRFYVLMLFDSIRIAVVTTGLCLLLGFPLSYSLSRDCSARWAKYAYMIVVAPLFTTAVVRAMAWLLILGRTGVINSVLIWLGVISTPMRLLYNEFAVVVGLVYVLLPFMVLAIGAVLENIDRSLEEAAADLGAGGVATFVRVTLPLSMPGVLAGSVLVFTLAVSSYVTPALLSGGRVPLVAILIFQSFLRTFDWQFGAVLAVLLMAVLVAIGVIYGRIRRWRVRHHLGMQNR